MIDHLFSWKRKARLAAFCAASLFAVFHGAARADECLSDEFGIFLARFSANADAQRRFTADQPAQLTLTRAKGADGFAPHTVKTSKATLHYPLLAPILLSGADNVNVEKVDARRINVIDRRAGNSNIKVFNFVRQSCWTLVGTEDWSIADKDLASLGNAPTNAPTNTPKRNAAENLCFQRGNAYLDVAGNPQYPLSKHLFAATLENYVCAAASGDPQASLAAAELSLSGMAPQLETPQVEALFKTAATTLADGASGLSTFYCYGNTTVSEGRCRQPELAEKELIRAAAMGSIDATHYLGYAFESGMMVTRDPYRAMACYRMAADKGSQIAASNLARLEATVIESTEPARCY